MDEGLSRQKDVTGKELPRLRPAMILLKLRTLIALFLLVVVFSFLTPNFFTVENMIILTTQVVLWALLGMGETLVVITGGIDLSVGAIVSLTGMIAGTLLYNGLVLRMFGVTVYFSVPTIICITLVVGAIIGAVNGLLVSRLNVTPFIATLGMLYVCQGLALLSSGGNTYSNLVGNPQYGNTGFPVLGSGTLLGIPIPVWIMVFFGIGLAYLLKNTPLGWYIYAVGGNEKAAELSGIKVNQVKMFVYIAAGICSAMVGLIITSQLVAANPSTGGGWELNAIAASVLGGTSLMGGKGTIAGAVIGAFVIGVLSDGMIMMGVSAFWQSVIEGSVIILAVVIEEMQSRLESRLQLEAR